MQTLVAALIPEEFLDTAVGNEYLQLVSPFRQFGVMCVTFFSSNGIGDTGFVKYPFEFLLLRCHADGN